MRVRRLLFSLFVGVTFLWQSGHAEDKYALIIGVADYQSPRIRDLKYTEMDALYLRDVLTQYARFESRNVKVLLGSQATYANIKREIFWLGEKARPEDLVVFFFSGHGTRVEDYERNEKDGYDEAFCPFETDLNDPSSVILDDEIGTWFRRIKSQKTVVILDCCHSGGAAGKSLEEDESKGLDMVGGATAKGLIDFEDDPYAKDLAPSNRFIMTASDAEEKSYEEPTLGHGIFTYYVGEALKGAGDTDKNRSITVNELFDYAKTRTLEKVDQIGKTQNPMQFGDLADVVVADLTNQISEVLNYVPDLELVTIRVDENMTSQGDRFLIRRRMETGARDLEIRDETVFEVEISQVFPQYAKAKVVRKFYEVTSTRMDDYYAERVATGIIKIRTEPWSTVYLDGNEIGVTPLIVEDVQVGEHELLFDFSQVGFSDQRKKIVVEENQSLVITERFNAQR